MQPGTAESASQEFIELYNQSPNAINFSTDGWQLQIASSTAADWTKAKSIKLSGLLYPGRYFLLASSYIAPGDTNSYLKDYASGQFSSGLSATSGHLRLVNTASLASTSPTEDALEWSTTNTAMQLTSPPIESNNLTLDSTITPGSSIKRHIESNGNFTYGSENDFLISLCPSPTANNTLAIDSSILQTLGVPVSTSVDVVNQSCVVNDASDSSVILQPTTQPSAILLPDNATSTSKVTAIIPAADVGLEAPQITEVLPNPAAPLADANDEFIELYNGNQDTFDLTGFVLSTANSGAHKYTFPSGTLLPAGSFMVWYSRDTGISLSNNSGQVILSDPFGNIINISDVYNNAKDGMSWALAQSAWQWTDVNTPGSQNIIHIKATPTPVVKAKSTLAKAQPKTKTTTAAKTVKTSAKKPTVTRASPAMKNTAAVSSAPIHIRIIALVGFGALLYGAYEYRRDMANRFYELRNNRAARRKTRQGD